MEDSANAFVPVPGRLVPVDTEQILAGTDTIYDDALGMRQSDINAGIATTVEEKVNNGLHALVDSEIGALIDGKIASAVDGLEFDDTNTLYKLSVNGTTLGSTDGESLGVVYTPTTGGIEGQFLKSNGSNTPVWADLPTEDWSKIPTEPVASASEKWNNFNLR